MIAQKEVLDDFWKTSPRTVLQYLGTELFREQMDKIIPHIGKNIWIEVVKRKLLDSWKKNPDMKFVITDVRFQNELDFIKEMGGITIKVVRDSANNNDDCHPSEMELDNLVTDHNISNNGTLDELFSCVNDILNN